MCVCFQFDSNQDRFFVAQMEKIGEEEDKIEGRNWFQLVLFDYDVHFDFDLI